MSDTDATVTHLRTLTDHLEKLGHRDLPEVVRARQHLDSLEKAKSKVDHDKAK